MPLVHEGGEPYEPGDVPPAGLWISPEGIAIPAVEHMAEIARDPERFGLSEREVRGAGVDVLLAAVGRLVKKGWIRFRAFSEAWTFEIDDLKKRLPYIEEVLAAHQAFEDERVVIYQVKPRREWEGSVGELFDRTLFRHFEVAGKRAVSWRST